MTSSYWHSISKRRSRGSIRYRYRWGKGRVEYGSEQIPGVPGDPLTEARAAEVKRWIALGVPPSEIIALISKWQTA
jgi:hypothetical protein